jgi:hypothetical protein
MKKVVTNEYLVGAPNVVKQRYNRRSIQSSVRRDTDPGPRDLNGTSWLDQGLAGALYTGGPSLGADFADLSGQFPGMDDSGAVASFNGWDTNFQSFSPTSLNPLIANSGVDTTPICSAPSVADGGDDSEDIADDKNATDALSSQLTSLSQRASHATRRLFRPGRPPLTVSSPAVMRDDADIISKLNLISNSSVIWLPCYLRLGIY